MLWKVAFQKGMPSYKADPRAHRCIIVVEAKDTDQARKRALAEIRMLVSPGSVVTSEIVEVLAVPGHSVLLHP